ncbi:helix-turn-helix domain-containing protein [Streptosporangium subroseum]|uniref:helix-turn-helix domain-containing protein n=1 Tax=Streptosporangium subroseum TaxID=106412 RepID=UPI0034149DE1
MREGRLPVSDALRLWLDEISVTAYAADDRCPLIHAPDPATVLVWRTTADGQGTVLAMGPRTHASYHDGKDIPVCVRFRIRPGSAPAVLGVSASEVVNRVVPLGELWGRSGDRLAGHLAGLGPDPALAVEHLQAALLSRVQGEEAHERARANLVRAAADELSTSTTGPPARVSEVAQHIGVSERQLRNIFTETIGVPPKRFARLSRVRTVLDGARHRPWARLASDAGYYDQSHMAAEFREVMHVTPSAFATGRLPTVPC